MLIHKKAMISHSPLPKLNLFMYRNGSGDFWCQNREEGPVVPQPVHGDGTTSISHPDAADEFNN